MQQQSPAQLYGLVAGILLVALGIGGFFYNGDFTSNEAVHDDMLGVLAVNGWTNTLHIATGVTALAWPSRACAALLGALYVGLAAWGFALGSGQSILGIVVVNTADDVLHLAIGVAGLVAAAISTRPATVPA
jgi:hypothetical protein